MNFSATPILTKLTQRTDLTQAESLSCAEALLRGEVSAEQGAALLTALKTKGETLDEITGFTLALKKHALVPVTPLKTFIDVCGTGGDQLKTFNISTATAFVLAGSGLKVAKHGNRSVSSSSGSADVLQQLGVSIEASPERQGEDLHRAGISFLFAPQVHPYMKNVMPLRKAIGLPTIFNVIGPLCNPLPLTYQIIGVYRKDLLEPMIQSMRALGVKCGAAVHGFGGMDELSLEGDNDVYLLQGDQVLRTQINGTDYGLTQAANSRLACASAEESATRILSVLSGEPGPYLDVVLLNAGLALKVAGTARTLEEGIDCAREAVTRGRALSSLKLLARKEVPREQAG